MTIQTMFVPELISKRTPARLAEAQNRLDTQALSPKNRRRLTAFVGTAPQAPVPAAEAPAKALSAAELRAKELRKQAQVIFERAAAEAPDGGRIKAGIKARREFLASHGL